MTPADVPASTPLPPTPGDVDLSSCLPGNPLGVRIDPNEVAGPDLEVVQGTVTREYSSAARQATPEQASAFVANLATAAGSACAVNVLKASVSSDPPPPKVDPAGLTGAVTPLAIGDGAALLALTGNLTVDVTPTPTGVELLAFRKGSVVVIVSAVAMQGPTIAGQTVELALKVAGRLS